MYFVLLSRCYALASYTLKNAIYRFIVISRTVGLAFNEAVIDKLSFFDKLRIVSSLHGEVVFLFLPIGFRTLVYTMLLLLVKPRKLILLVSPLSKYVEKSITAEVLRRIFNLLFSIYRLIGIDVLLIYPTPFEKKLLPPLPKGIEWVFIPIMDSSTYSREMLIPPRDYDGIAIFTNDVGDLVKINEFHKLMKQVWGGFKILIISDQGSLSLCLPLPSVSCIETDSYDEIISKFNLIAFMTPTIATNNILYMSVINSRIVLADHRIGLSYYMRSYGYLNVIIMDKWEPEKMFDTVVSVINQADSIKKSILALRPLEIKYDYGLGYLKYFITR